MRVLSSVYEHSMASYRRATMSSEHCIKTNLIHELTELGDQLHEFTKKSLNEFLVFAVTCEWQCNVGESIHFCSSDSAKKELHFHSTTELLLLFV
jgi:hypothetical protein